MTGVTVKIDAADVRRLEVDLGKAGPRSVEKATRAIDKGGNDIEGTAKVLAPVDTGYLRSSIGQDHLGPLEVVIGPTANYGAFVEYGVPHPYRISAKPGGALRFTVDGHVVFAKSVVHPPSAPHPYLGPAFDRHSGELTDALELIADETLL